jgi:streptomycin 6-kinase
MLKLMRDPHEVAGIVLLEWWSGDGAARILQRQDSAVLIERAAGRRSLADMARANAAEDAEACRILCGVVRKLHAPRPRPLVGGAPMSIWFRDLETAAATQGGIFARCWKTAQELLADPREVVPLHGDIHHGNVLDFGARGWLAIDPKHLVGERAFDYANIFANPDLDDPTRPVAVLPGRFAARLNVILELSGLERERLLRWVLAWSGLSAAWFVGDKTPADTDLHIAQLAAAELDR